MSEKETIIIFFGIAIAIAAIVLVLIAFKFYYKYLIQEKRCTSKVKGCVKRYTLASHGGDAGVFLPIVYYMVDGKEYHVVGPEYKAYIYTNVSTPTNDNNMNFKEVNQKLIIHRTNNSIFGISKNPMTELYPINSELDVFYDPSNPKLAYVLRYCNNKFYFWFIIVASLLLILIWVLIAIFVK